MLETCVTKCAGRFEIENVMEPFVPSNEEMHCEWGRGSQEDGDGRPP